MHTHSLSVVRQSDVFTSRRTAKQMAQELGFNEQHQEEIALVVSELATNLIKHAVRGVITLKAVHDYERTGIIISSQDQGPGFDVALALTDGYSSSGTLGYGLGAVKRMMDDLEIHSNQDHYRGTHIICKKWLLTTKPVHHKPLDCPLDIAVISHPKPGQELNGDSYVIKHSYKGTLVAVIDGVGHGFMANRSAQAARLYIEHHSDQSLADIIHGANRACMPTTGVVMALAYVDWHSANLTFASIGNIEAKAFGSEKVNLPVRRGIIGRNPPKPLVVETPWSSGMMLVLHSDGLSTRWHWGDFEHLISNPAQILANHMYHKLQKAQDDATLLLVKW